MEVKNKVTPLSHLRKPLKVNGKSLYMDPLKLFHRLVLVAERDMEVEESLAYELTPVPLSLFEPKTNLMNKANKASFAKEKLKVLTGPCTIDDKAATVCIIDGGWLLHQVKWQEGERWQDIANSYVQYVHMLGRNDQYIVVVFDGYSSSTKDHEHVRRTKNSSADIAISSAIVHWTSRPKFLANLQNKSQLIEMLVHYFQENEIFVERSEHDADSLVVKEALNCSAHDVVEVSHC